MPSNKLLYSGDILKHRIKPDSDLADVLQHSLSCNVAGTATEYEKDNSQTEAYVTAKLFLPRGVTTSEAGVSIKEALDTCKTKKRGGIKHFIISLQDITFSDIFEDGMPSEIPPDKISGLWKIFTKQGIESGIVEEYGISELSTERLKDLLTAIDQEEKSKDTDDSPIPVPTIDHINASDCCALPPGLITLSRDRNIKLLAHHDPEDLLPIDRLKNVYPNATSWRWILRLTSIVKDRQILAGNEYYVAMNLE